MKENSNIKFDNWTTLREFYTINEEIGNGMTGINTIEIWSKRGTGMLS